MSDHILFRFAVLIPIQEKGSSTPPMMHPGITLAPDMDTAIQLAQDAGLLLIGQIAADGSINPAKPST